MEMGGKSTQIAFVPTDPLLAGEFQVKIGGNEYSVYVHSYLQLGLNGIPVRIVKKLTQDSGKPGGPVENPCLMKGDKADVTLEDGKVVATSSTTRNDKKCLEILQKMLEPSKDIDCQPKPCAVDWSLGAALIKILHRISGQESSVRRRSVRELPI